MAEEHCRDGGPQVQPGNGPCRPGFGPRIDSMGREAEVQIGSYGLDEKAAMFKSSIEKAKVSKAVSRFMCIRKELEQFLNGELRATVLEADVTELQPRSLLGDVLRFQLLLHDCETSLVEAKEDIGDIVNQQAELRLMQRRKDVIVADKLLFLAMCEEQSSSHSGTSMILATRENAAKRWKERDYLVSQYLLIRRQNSQRRNIGENGPSYDTLVLAYWLCKIAKRHHTPLAEEVLAELALGPAFYSTPTPPPYSRRNSGGAASGSACRAVSRMRRGSRETSAEREPEPEHEVAEPFLDIDKVWNGIAQRFPLSPALKDGAVDLFYEFEPLVVHTEVLERWDTERRTATPTRKRGLSFKLLTSGLHPLTADKKDGYGALSPESPASRRSPSPISVRNAFPFRQTSS